MGHQHSVTTKVLPRHNATLRYNTEMPVPPEVGATLEAGGTIVASTVRAVRALRRQHGEDQRKQGHSAWLAPDILDWDSWLNRLWQKQLRAGHETRLLLSSLQEQQVWIRLIKPTIEGRRLISSFSVAELAQQAYALLGNYRALRFLRHEQSGDVENFRDWARGFEARCQREGWVSRSLLATELLRAIEEGKLEAAQTVTFLGFDRTTPAQQKLMEAFGHREPTLEPSHTTAQIFAAPDKRSEMQACASWIQQQLVTASRIAIVVPGISTVRPEMQRVFQELLAPDTVTIRNQDRPLPFEFSLGVPLAQVPMARAAVLLLRWMAEPILQDELSWLLLSGLVSADEEETLAIAAFDARLRQLPMRQREQDLETFLDLMSEGWKEAIPLSALRHRLRAARKLVSARESASFAAWTAVAGEVLSTMAWPGPQVRYSEDFQAEARWSRLLDQVAELSFDGRTVSYGEFLEVLEQQAQQTIFSPESHDAPIQILGPLEAAGLTFDALWFLGADDATWPAPARPHPFLPKSLQREYQMPHADSELDWNLAQQVTRRLLASAKNCVFSYPRQNENGECRRSTILDFALKEISLPAPTPGKTVPLETEEEAATVVPWPVAQEAGGADVLKRQAACAFQAFATKRLAARPMEETDWGLDARGRGNVVHKILEVLWKELKSHEGLLAAREEDRLTGMITELVRTELAGYGKHLHERSLSWSRTYLEAEEERIITLIGLWLDYEAKRAPFTFEEGEKKLPALAGELKLQVRVDRVDQVAGGRVIIDYKTGEVKSNVWEGDRPDEPQLLLYAGQVESLKGLLLARVNTEKTKFVGRVADGQAVITQSDLLKPPLTLNMLQGWQHVIADLGRQFLSGEAQVNPKNGHTTCTFCRLPGLCRVAEVTSLNEEEDGDEDDE
jgi:ATP-dependent helicase/nuclease subunit B